MKRTAACLLILVAAAASAAGIKEGQWEMTTQMAMPGMPQMPALPPGVQLPAGLKLPSAAGGAGSYTAKTCVTQDHPVPKLDREGMKCDVTQQTFSGDTLNWATHCVSTDGGVLDGQGSATYSGDTMTSQSHMTGKMHGHPIDMTMATTGKFLGPCPAN